MATLELECEKCGWSDMGNVPLRQCPKCNTLGVSVLWDEANDCHDCDCQFEALPDDNTDWEE